MRTSVMLAAVLVGAAVLGGCSENPATGERQLRLISDQQEIAMGSEAAPEFEQEFMGVVPDAQVQTYVNQVGQRVAAQSEREMPYEFKLLRSDLPNAFALPGGKIYITDGLLQIMGTERELAAVLGHEVGHVAAAHNVQGMQRQMGTSVLAEIAAAAVGGRAGEAAKVATQVTAGMVNLKYSRGDENQADQLGIRYLAKAGYNPWGMVEMLNSLAEASGGGGGGGTLASMFSTHPLTEDRIEKTQETVQREYPQAQRGAAQPNNEAFLQTRQRARQFMVPQKAS